MERRVTNKLHCGLSAVECLAAVTGHKNRKTSERNLVFLYHLKGDDGLFYNLHPEMLKFKCRARFLQRSADSSHEGFSQRSASQSQPEQGPISRYHTAHLQ